MDNLLYYKNRGKGRQSSWVDSFALRTLSQSNTSDCVQNQEYFQYYSVQVGKKCLFLTVIAYFNSINCLISSNLR